MAKSFNITDKDSKISEERNREIPQTSEKEKLPLEKEVKKKKEEKPKKEKKVLFKNFNWKTLLFPVAAVLTLVGIVLFFYYGIYKVRPKPLTEVFVFDEMYIVSKEQKQLFSKNLPLLSAPKEPRTEESPLNGILFSKKEMDEMKKRRPVGVMTNNHIEARPLSGLNSADIIIEANVESGITRILALYWSKAPEKVGPIRSLRQPYLEWASAYDPLLIYDGCAQTDNPKTNACGNVHSYGTKIIGTMGAWRSNEGGRVAPHNEYSSVTNAWEHAKKMDWDQFPSSIESLKFKKDLDLADRGKKTHVRITFHTRLQNGGAYNTEWIYDTSTNSYFRKAGGRADMDAETNTQISAKVVIIQEVKVTPSGDNAGRLITTTIGQGNAVILQDGKIVNGKWQKDSRKERTKYYDSSGNPMEFNRGRIWISMIPHSDGKFDIIEQ